MEFFSNNGAILVDNKRFLIKGEECGILETQFCLNDCRVVPSLRL